jgi:hypothetical protein
MHLTLNYIKSKIYLLEAYMSYNKNMSDNSALSRYLNENITLEQSRRNRAEKERRARERREHTIGRDVEITGTLLDDFFRDYNIPAVEVPHYQYDVLDRAMSASNADVLNGYHVQVPTSDNDDTRHTRKDMRAQAQHVDHSTDADWNTPSNNTDWR